MTDRSITVLRVEDDLDESARALAGVEPLLAGLWNITVEHDPEPPVSHPGRYVLRIAWRGPDGPRYLARPGDVLTIDRDAASWDGLRLWACGPGEDEDGHHAALMGAWLDAQAGVDP